MVTPFEGVAGVLAALAVIVGVAVLAASAVAIRSLGTRAALTVRAAAAGLRVAGATVAASAKQSADGAYGALQADLIVHGAAPLDPATVAAIRAVRSVDLAASGATARATVNGADTEVASWDDNGAANLLMARRA